MLHNNPQEQGTHLQQSKTLNLTQKSASSYFLPNCLACQIYLYHKWPNVNIHVHLQVKCLLFLSNSKQTTIWSTNSSEKSPTHNSWKSTQRKPICRQTDRHNKPNSCVSSLFCKYVQTEFLIKQCSYSSKGYFSQHNLFINRWGDWFLWILHCWMTQIKQKCYYTLQRNYILFLQFLSCKWKAPILLNDFLHTFQCNYISPETGV